MSGNLGCAGRSVMLFAVALLAAPNTCAQGQFKILHNFGAGTDGAGLYSILAIDKHGNLYGTTTGGGGYGQGVVYQLRRNPALSGEWTEEVLHSFSMGSGDGWGAFGGVTIDGSGNLYGTTWDGGANGRGMAFELTPGSNGWIETIIYSFCPLPCVDGGGVSYRPLLDRAGNLFDNGGAEILYELSPGDNGWTDTVLYTFCAQQGPCPDGYDPDGALVRDTFGNLYGVTTSGGYYNGACQQTGCGVVYELAQLRSGAWQETVLYAFEGEDEDDGRQPIGALTAHAGALYGVTADGGGSGCEAGCGTMFELARGPSGATEETVLYRFGDGANGSVPIGPVVFDRAGNIYGVTGYGGSNCDCGVLYELTPGTTGTWRYAVLHAFTGDDGIEPSAGLAIDSKGNIYGTTVLGGRYNGGVVFEYSPP